MNEYRMGSKLKTGGMGDIYLAHDLGLDRPVAIKILKASLAENPEFVERFLLEARLCARLNHPNIIRVFATGTDNEQPYIVMELLDGEDLRERLQRGTLPVSEASAITQSVLLALSEAHSKGIIHRDIKSANVFLCRNGEVKVMDFGIAKALDNSYRTQTGTMIGTPDYMSPEQCNGAAVDGRSDVYSVGILLYALLTGNLPFQATTPLTVLHKHLTQPPPPLPDALPEWIRSIVAKALEKDPVDRFQSAEEMRVALAKQEVVVVKPQPAGKAQEAETDYRPLVHDPRVSAESDSSAQKDSPAPDSVGIPAPIQPVFSSAPVSSSTSSRPVRERPRAAYLVIGLLLCALLAFGGYRMLHSTPPADDGTGKKAVIHDPPLPPPKKFVKVKVCTGKFGTDEVATRFCPQPELKEFEAGTEPKQECEKHIAPTCPKDGEVFTEEELKRRHIEGVSSDDIRFCPFHYKVKLIR